MNALVDTSALYAVLDRDDANHVQARAAWQGLLERDASLITTNYIVVETFALVQRRLGIEAVRTVASDVLPVLRIEWVSELDHQAATAALLAVARRDLSFVDLTSFQIMRRLGLREAFAFDRHFSEQGFLLHPAGER